ncbi:MAG: hypothetical protein AB7S75_18950 [Desulfococcaceae bacterium]
MWQRHKERHKDYLEKVKETFTTCGNYSVGSATEFGKPINDQKSFDKYLKSGHLNKNLYTNYHALYTLFSENCLTIPQKFYVYDIACGPYTATIALLLFLSNHDSLSDRVFNFHLCDPSEWLIDKLNSLNPQLSQNVLSFPISNCQFHLNQYQINSIICPNFNNECNGIPTILINRNYIDEESSNALNLFFLSYPGFGPPAPPAPAYSPVPVYGQPASPAPAYSPVPVYGQPASPAPAYSPVPVYGQPAPPAPAYSPVPAYGQPAPPAPAYSPVPAYGQPAPPAPAYSPVPAYGQPASPAPAYSPVPVYGPPAPPPPVFTNNDDKYDRYRYPKCVRRLINKYSQIQKKSPTYIIYSHYRPNFATRETTENMFITMLNECKLIQNNGDQDVPFPTCFYSIFKCEVTK